MNYDDIIRQIQAAQGGTPGATGGVNRGAPAVAPSIPVPGNQNMNPGGYMQQAMRLSGVPGLMPQQQQPQINPMMQALSGTSPQQGAMSPQIQQILAGINPQYLQQIMAALSGVR